MHGLHKPFRMLMLAAAVFVAHPAVTNGQSAALQELMTQKQNWPRFAQEERRIQFEGRFLSRTQDTFRLQKFDAICRLPASIRLPDRMAEGQRLELTGKFRSDSGHISFLVNRLIVRGTDIDELSRRTEEIAASQPRMLLDLANEFTRAAEFYGDQKLEEQITTVRGMAIRRMRSLAKGDLVTLRDLQQQAKSLQVDLQLQELLNFEILFRTSRQPDCDLKAILNDVQQLKGWDQRIPPPPERLKSSFADRAVEEYDSGSADTRQALHRILYVDLRVREVRGQLKPDGSNGVILAELVKKEFPEEGLLVTDLMTSEIQSRLTRVDSLSRKELQQLISLLKGQSKPEQVAAAVEQWLKAQVQIHGTETLQGLLRTSDEYFFAAEQLQRPDARDRGVELLKKACELAKRESPSDAVDIAARLESLGWVWLNDRWMSTREVEMLPKDDIQLAIRDGRVVPGMTTEQVLSAQGQPERISRIGSSRQLRELWVYDTKGIVVRFRKSLTGRAETFAVEEVSRISAGPRGK